jgi:hypothetical protein
MCVRRFSTYFGYMILGLIVWTAFFVFIYGFQAVACAKGWADITALDQNIVSVGIGVATLAAVAILVAQISRELLTSRGSNQEQRFARSTTLLFAWLSAVAILWSALPAAILSSCGH